MKKAITIKKATGLYGEAERARRGIERVKQNQAIYSDRYLKDYEERLKAMESELKEIAESSGLNAELETVQKRAKVRCTNYDEIFRILTNIEKELNISKKAMNGIKAVIDPNAQDFPRSYKFTPQSTIITAEYKNGAWKIEIERAETRKDRALLSLTEEAEKAILSNYRKMNRI